MTNMQVLAEQNFATIASKQYPGRGIIQGLSPSGDYVVQLYWLMGRSVNSRNRVLLAAGDTVRTEAFDPSLLSDPSLIIYNSVRTLNNWHILGNGDQTDSIHAALSNGASFEEAVYERTFEPDPPTCTPRISAIFATGEPKPTLKLAIVKSDANDPEREIAAVFTYKNPRKGFGRFISTYHDNGEPIPPFSGEPLIVPLREDPQDTLALYWHAINEANKIAMLVKYVHVRTGEATVHIINRHTSQAV